MLFRSNDLDSCEMNTGGTSQWTYTTSLPRPFSGLRGVTLDNRVLMTGERSNFCNLRVKSVFVGGGHRDRDEIWELVDGTWRQVATMLTARYDHAVSVIELADYWQYCRAKVQSKSMSKKKSQGLT